MSFLLKGEVSGWTEIQLTTSRKGCSRASTAASPCSSGLGWRVWRSAEAAPCSASSRPRPRSALGVLEEASIVPTLPAAVRKYYELATTTPLGASVFRKWTPKNGPPWKLGFSSSFAGNTWRIGARTRLQTVMLPTYKKAGLVSSVITTESNLVMATQIQQIRQLVDQGCRRDLHDRGGPDRAERRHQVRVRPRRALRRHPGRRRCTPYALHVERQLRPRRQAAGSRAWRQTMGGKGNVLVVQGITQADGESRLRARSPDGPGEVPRHQGRRARSPAVGRLASPRPQVLQFLSTHPQPLGGIATQSPGDLGAMSALQQTGRTIVPMTAGGETGPARLLARPSDLDLGDVPVVAAWLGDAVRLGRR